MKTENSRSPSHADVADAWELWRWLFGMKLPRLAMVSHSCLPVSRSYARIDCTWFSSSAVVTNTRRPHVTGDECPRPGTSACQTMFSVGLQVRGTFCCRAIPLRLGPRHQGQSVGATWTGGNCSNFAASPAISSAPGTLTANRVRQSKKHDMAETLDPVRFDCSAEGDATHCPMISPPESTSPFPQQRAGSHIARPCRSVGRSIRPASPPGVHRYSKEPSAHKKTGATRGRVAPVRFSIDSALRLSVIGLERVQVAQSTADAAGHIADRTRHTADHGSDCTGCSADNVAGRIQHSGHALANFRPNRSGQATETGAQGRNLTVGRGHGDGHRLTAIDGRDRAIPVDGRYGNRRGA